MVVNWLLSGFEWWLYGQDKWLLLVVNPQVVVNWLLSGFGSSGGYLIQNNEKSKS